MVRPDRFERPTSSMSQRRCYQLSYGRAASRPAWIEMVPGSFAQRSITSALQAAQVQISVTPHIVRINGRPCLSQDLGGSNRNVPPVCIPRF